jgi:hypothetical protein
MSKAPGTSGTMPITGAACGIKPSKEAMEVDFTVDFSQAKQFLPQEQTLDEANDDLDEPTSASDT